MASNRSRSRSPKNASPRRRPEKVDSRPGNEDGKTKFDDKELKKITVKICRPNLQKEQTDLKRAILNPELIAPVRRPDEGKKPIFDRAELRNGPRVLLDEESEVPSSGLSGGDRRTRDRSKSKGRHYRSDRSRERCEQKRGFPKERSRSRSEKRVAAVDDRHRSRSRSRSHSKSRRGTRRSSRERSVRDRSRSHEDYYEEYHEGSDTHRNQGMMMRPHPLMIGYPPPRAMIPYMPVPPGYRPPFPPRFFPRF